MSGPSVVANVEQAENWDSRQGDHWVEYEERYNASIRPHSARLLGAARVASSDNVLDIGCGCGETTRDAARAAVSGTALGVDLSARMLERARERSGAEGLTNVSFEQADAQVHPFQPQAFDIAVSRFGSMFFGDPVAAFRNIGRALRPGGRLALLAWQALEGNEWASVVRAALAVGRDLPRPPLGAPGPFGLAEPEFVRHVLGEAGFAEVGFEEVQEPICLGATGADAYAFMSTSGMAHGLLDGLDDDARARALEELRKTLAASETPEGVRFDSRAWLITARRS